MAIDPHYEYTLPALSRETGVSVVELERACRRRMLAAVKGPGGRGGRWRVLGKSYMTWSEQRHGLAPRRPRAEDDLDRAIKRTHQRILERARAHGASVAHQES